MIASTLLLRVYRNRIWYEVGEENWDLVTRLATARLVVTGGDETAGVETVEIVHEALIREWGTLRKWLDESRDKRRQKWKIEVAAREWLGSRRSKDYLLQGKRLRETREFQQEEVESFALSSLAEEFIKASIRQQDRDRLELINVFVMIPLIGTIIAGVTITKEFELYRYQQTIDECRGKERCPGRISALEQLYNAGREIRRFNLEKAYLEKIRLQKADLPEANLQGANLEEADLQGADLQGANLQGANLQGAKLQGADLEEAKLQGAKLQGANLQGTFLCKTNFQGANLQAAKLQGAKLQEAFFCKTNFQGANLGEANLQGANLEEVNLQGANLQGANLQEANLFGADLEEANLFGANLGEANLQEANLFGADLEEANLFGANLGEANLQGANLQGVLLLGTHFGEANLQGANLQGALLLGTHLPPKRIKSACNWQKALFDEDFRKQLDSSPDPKEKPDCTRWQQMRSRLPHSDLPSCRSQETRNKENCIEFEFSIP